MMALKKTTPETAAADRESSEWSRVYTRDFDGLCAQLQDDKPNVRRWAARDLALHPAAVAALCQRLQVETEASVRAALFTALARIGGDAVADALLPLLRSEVPALRNGAIDLLAGLPAEVAPRMRALLRDDDSDVRIFAVNLLGQLPHPQVPVWLAEVLAQDDNANVVGAALEVAAEVGGPELAAPLRQARQRFAADPFIAFAADLALQRIGST